MSCRRGPGQLNQQVDEWYRWHKWDCNLIREHKVK